MYSVSLIFKSAYLEAKKHNTSYSTKRTNLSMPEHMFMTKFVVHNGFTPITIPLVA